MLVELLINSCNCILLYEVQWRAEFFFIGWFCRGTCAGGPTTEEVQDVNYPYTLEGWIKGVNSDLLKTSRDMGKDAQSAAHALFGKDAYGFTLGYFDLDYRPIGINKFEMAAPTSGGFGQSSSSLYNGNIRRAVYALRKLADSTLGYSYHYDQLNRLISTSAWNNYTSSTFSWNTSGSALTKWQEQIAYDPNGNILTYQRTGSSPVKMDSLVYHYPNGKNQLTYVDDAVSFSSNYTTDIDDQSSGNYTYDATGNLVSDAQEQISLIKWTVAGKVDSIARSGGSTKDKLKFYYDASGNRVGKIDYPNSGPTTKTWYVRDAQGNIMATYALTNTSSHDTLRWKEQDVYGSSRLGLWQPNMRLYPTQFSLPGDTFHFITKAGDKRYELTNHLGNVMAVVTDRKIAVGTNNAAASYYLPDIASVQDYYPFGMLEPGRNFSSDNYRFGMNGQEKDNEVSGTGNSYTAEYWQYDPRLVRRWDVEPLIKESPAWSPYAAFADNPVLFLDPNGKNVVVGVTSDAQGNKTLTVTVNAVLINRSNRSLTEAELDVYKSSLESQAKITLSGTYWNVSDYSTGRQYQNVKVDFNLNVSVISDEKEIKKDDHVIAIVDDVPPLPSDDDPTGDPIGRAQIGANVAFVEWTPDRTRTGIHELGHLLGLDHDKQFPDALMYYKGGKGLNLSSNERVTLYNRYLGESATYRNATLALPGTGNSKLELDQSILNWKIKTN